MGKESRVEIPDGSGNYYRYEYIEGDTLYRGPVGDAPALSEGEFDEFFKAGKRRQKQMKVTILQRGGERTVSGFVDKEARAKRHKILEDATRFYGSELMSTRMRNLLKIRIEMRKTKLEKDTLGEVGNLLIGSEKQRDFTIITRRDASLEQQLSTLAHEMVHVRQIAMNQLQVRRWKSDWKIHTRWKGEEMPLGLEYKDYPWEHEAKEVGDELLEKWRVEMKRRQESGEVDYL